MAFKKQEGYRAGSKCTLARVTTMACNITRSFSSDGDEASCETGVTKKRG